MPPKYASRWQNLGSNSGNMTKHRIVKSNVLQFDAGKFKDINIVERPIVDDNGIVVNTGYKETLGISFKGLTVFDNNPEIQNVVNSTVLGVGTEKPFSRISLGSNVGDGLFNNSNTKGGQNSAIALHEESDGRNFNGLVYDEKIIQQYQLNSDEQIMYTKSIGIFSNKNTPFSLTNLNINTETNEKTGGRIYITDDDRLVVGGKPRMGLEKGVNTLIENDRIKIKLDVQGSIRTDGYINFINYSDNTTTVLNQTDYDNWLQDVDNKANLANVENIPKGSIWMGLDKTFNYEEGITITSNQPKLYFKDSNGSIQQINTSSVGQEIVFNGKLTVDNEATFGYIFNNTSSDKPTRITISGESFPIDTDSSTDPDGFNNALTIRRGNVAVVGRHGANYEIKIPNYNDYKQEYYLKNDDIGGSLWTERQIGIGPNKSDKIYAILDLESYEGVPSFISAKTYNLFNYTQIRLFDNSNILTVEITCGTDAFFIEGEKIQTIRSDGLTYFEGLHIITNADNDNNKYQYILTTEVIVNILDKDLVDSSNANFFLLPDSSYTSEGGNIEQNTVINITGDLPNDLRSGIHYVDDIIDGKLKIFKTYSDITQNGSGDNDKIRKFNFNFKPNKATNSIILLDESNTNQTEITGLADQIGQTTDARNCIMFGELQNVNVANSIIGGGRNIVTGTTGESLVLGNTNNVANANNICVLGADNTVTNSGTEKIRLLVGDNSTEDSTDPNNALFANNNFVVTENGNIGLGTRQPQQKLDIKEGVIKINGVKNNTPNEKTHNAAYFWHQHNIGPTISGYKFQVRTADHTATVDNGIARFTVDHEGKIGIGTEAPDHMLHLKSSGDVVLRIEADTDNDASEIDNPLIWLSQDGSSADYFKIGMEGAMNQSFTNSLSDACFLNAHQNFQIATAGAARLTIKDNGKVGINTNNPTHHLHIDSGVLKITQNTPPGEITNNAAYFWHQGGVGPTISGNKFQVRTGSLTDGTPALTIDDSQNVTIAGNLNVNGTTTTINTENTTIKDKLIVLGHGTTGTPSGDAGIIMERGSSPNIFMGWSETLDKIIMGTTIKTGNEANPVTNNVGVVGLAAGKVEMTSLRIGGTDITTSAAELNYVDGVTSAIQTQLNAKAPLASPTLTGIPKAPTAAASTNTTQIATTAFVTNAVTTQGSSASSALATETSNREAADTVLQTDINTKQATITGAATTITASNLTASCAMVSDASGKVAVSDVTATELGYLGGVTSNIQTQINSLTGTTTDGTTSDSTATLTTKVNKLISLSGVPASSENLGTFTGSTIGDNKTKKAALQDLETAIDANTTKLSGIAAGAEVNVQADWNATSGDAQILNKPSDNQIIDWTAASAGTIDSSNYTNTTYNAATTSVDGLMTKDDKAKLDGIAAGAEVNVQADWNATSGDAQILNKPSDNQIIDWTVASDSTIDQSNFNLTITSGATTVFSAVAPTDSDTGAQGTIWIHYDSTTSTKKIYVQVDAGTASIWVDFI